MGFKIIVLLMILSVSISHASEKEKINMRAVINEVADERYEAESYMVQNVRYKKEGPREAVKFEADESRTINEVLVASHSVKKHNKQKLSKKQYYKQIENELLENEQD